MSENNNQQSRLSSVLSAQLKEDAQRICATSVNIGDPNSDETQAIMQMEVKLVTDIIELTNAGLYDIHDSGIIQDGISKAITDINNYLHTLNDKIDILEEKIEDINIKESVFDESNRDRATQRNEKEAELRNTSIFNRTKRKELQEDIANLRPLEPPMDFTGEKKRLNNLIDNLKELMKPLQDKVKGVINAQMTAERHLGRNKANNQSLDLNQEFQRTHPKGRL